MISDVLRDYDVDELKSKLQTRGDDDEPLLNNTLEEKVTFRKIMSKWIEAVNSKVSNIIEAEDQFSVIILS